MKICSETLPAESYTLAITPRSNTCTLAVFLRGDTVLQETELGPPDQRQEVVVELPRANDYRFTITGELDLQLSPGIPIAIEASEASPAAIHGSGPLYFYVPRGATRLVMKIEGTISIAVPRHNVLTLNPDDADPKSGYVVVPVPGDAAGTLWHLTADTHGSIALLNTPPLLHLHRDRFLALREVSQSDGLTTVTRQEAEAGRWKP